VSLSPSDALHKVALRVFKLSSLDLGNGATEVREQLVALKHFDEAQYAQAVQKAERQKKYFGDLLSLQSLAISLNGLEARYLKVQLELQDSHKTVHGLKGAKHSQPIQNLMPYIEGEVFAKGAS